MAGFLMQACARQYSHHVSVIQQCVFKWPDALPPVIGCRDFRSSASRYRQTVPAAMFHRPGLWTGQPIDQGLQKSNNSSHRPSVGNRAVVPESELDAVDAMNSGADWLVTPTPNDRFVCQAVTLAVPEGRKQLLSMASSPTMCLPERSHRSDAVTHSCQAGV